MKDKEESLEDRLAPDEPAYKSRGEIQVGRLLDRYGILFFYEQPLLVYDQDRYHIWKPDFTLPHQGGLIVEYAGMPDVPSYMDGVRHKQQVYQQNGVPALFLYPKDLSGYNWRERAAEQIHDAGEQAMHYGRSWPYANKP